MIKISALEIVLRTEGKMWNYKKRNGGKEEAMASREMLDGSFGNFWDVDLVFVDTPIDFVLW